MTPDQQTLPLLDATTGQPLTPPPDHEYRVHTAEHWEKNDIESYAFALYLVRSLGLTVKLKIVELVSAHRNARGLPGISRNSVTALFHSREFKPGEIDEIIKRNAHLVVSSAIAKVEELLEEATSAKDLGAAAMALTSIHNVSQLVRGNATRISGTSGDAEKAKGFDFFLQKAKAKLLTETPPSCHRGDSARCRST